MCAHVHVIMHSHKRSVLVYSFNVGHILCICSCFISESFGREGENKNFPKLPILGVSVIVAGRGKVYVCDQKN